MFNNYKKEDEEVISEKIGYPYSILPKGFPNKISNKKIQETINIFFDNLKSNAGAQQIVDRDSTFINLGLNELNSRNNRRQSKIAFWLSVFSVVVALLSFIVSVSK